VAAGRNAGVPLRVLLALAALSFVPLAVLATAPQWWTSRGVLNPSATPNDYAPINQGQLKNLAVQAYQEMRADLPAYIWTNAASTNLTALTNHFSPTNNYLPANLGQLKAVTAPFYETLIAVGYATNYPWNSSTNAANDYAMANIGQAKNLFAFDPGLDSDTNGLPDWWEMKYFGHLGNSGLAANGLTLLQDYQQGINPTVGGSSTNSAPTPGDNANALVIDPPDGQPWYGWALIEPTDQYENDEAYQNGNTDVTHVTIQWADPTDGVTGFKVQRKLSTRSWTVVYTCGSNINFYIDPDVQLANQQVQYRVTPMYGMAPGTSVTVSYLIPLLKTMMQQKSEASGFSPGFHQLTNLPQPPKTYLVAAMSGGASSINPSPTSYFDAGYSVTETITPVPDPVHGMVASLVNL
jgi:hypothetical protein